MSHRILILIKGLGRGGAEQLLASAAPHFDRERFTYEVAYLLPEKEALVGELREAGVTVHCLHGASGIAWLARLRDLTRRRAIDLVHSHLPYAGAGARLARLRTPHVYTEHNEWQCYRRSTYWANLLTFGLSAHVFAVSGHVRSSMRYPAGLGAVLRMPPVEVLYHGIDPAAIGGWEQRDGVREEFRIPEEAPLVGTVANLRTEKALDVMLDAMRRARRELPDLRLLLVGQGPLERELRTLSQRMDLTDTVIFAGYRADAQRIVAATDVFALSSDFEGLSIALVEAMALGRPSVVTDAGGLSEVVSQGETGIVVPRQDPAALANAVVELLRDPTRRARYGRAAQAKAAAFDIRHAVQRMEAVYQELLA
jgi:glycosyltransferase involved in cell wall biosynthesis